MKNRTGKYLYSVFSTESENFKRYYNSLKRESLYIGDDIYFKESGIIYNNHIYVLIDLDNTSNFDEALAFFRVYDNYEDDYYIDERFHMLVFKIDSKFRKTLYYFKKSQYNKMYSLDYLDVYYSISKSYELMYDNNALDLEACQKLIKKFGSLEMFIKEVKVSTYAVLAGSKELRDMYNSLFGLYDKQKLDRNHQLDSEINLKDEIFRYNPEIREEIDLEKKGVNL